MSDKKESESTVVPVSTPPAQEWSNKGGAGSAASYGTAAAASANSSNTDVEEDVNMDTRTSWPVLANMSCPPSEEKIKTIERSLWWWNLSCAIFHGVQAAVALGLGQGSSRAGKFRVPLITTFLTWDPIYAYPRTELVTRAIVPFSSLTSGFAWMSCVAHIIILLCFKKYLADLRQGINRFRWIEYAFSSSLMIVLIAMLFGVYSATELFALGSVNAVMCLMGYMMELHNQTTKKVDWTSFVFGCFAGAVPWAIIITYVVGSGVVERIPSFVWAILIIYFLAFNTFSFAMGWTYSGWGWWGDKYWGYRMGGYYFGERSYQIQSLVSKSILLWLVLGGSNQPNQYTAN